MDSSSQLKLLTDLINISSTSQLTFLNNLIAPKLKRDFVHDLPLELAHHILSFVDDPKSLTRAAQVSKFWNQLVETEDWVWKSQCIKHFGPTSCSSLPSPKAFVVPPTSHLYTASPSSMDAVSSTLRALTGNSSGHSRSFSSGTGFRSRPSSRPVSSSSASQRLSLTFLPGSSGSALQLQGVAASESLSLTSSSSASAAASATAVLSSMLLTSKGSLSTSTALSALEGRSTTSSALTAAGKLIKRMSLNDLQDLTMDPARSRRLQDSAQQSCFQQQYQQQQQQYPQQGRRHRHHSQISQKRPCSYKSYFKRRYMIDRNWVTGHHSLISYTTPETGVVTSLQFDHHHIAVGCDNSLIQIFETTTGRLLRTLQGHHGGVWALEFYKGIGATGEKILVSGGCDRELRVWDMNTGKCRQVMCGHTGTIRCLKLHQLPLPTVTNKRNSDITVSKYPSLQQQLQHLAITGSRDSTLRVWDLQTGKTKFLLQGHRDPVRCIEAHDGLLVSGSYDCTARVWSLVTGECLHVLLGHFQQIYSIAFNGEYIVTGSLDSTCRLWSPVTGACHATLQGHTQLVGQLQLSGDSLMTGGGDGFMYLWNLRTFECQYRVQAHDQSVTSLCFDAKRVVTGGNDGAVKLWDRQTGKFIRLLTKTDAAIWRVSICEERVVMCMQKNGCTAMEVMCFDSEAPVLSDTGANGIGGTGGGAETTAVQHETLMAGDPSQRQWNIDGLRSFDDMRI
ncbi:hypothetical protein BG011_006205 [Mortierella polycephala]|uniref:F-box domain-containing protein n=1 Tax=Mortierella polycephala TaxID=41804 RepID=A0A9P6TZY2_9FUNG|nr:hypothetical protein BG011_006205 [Mortierella polycephala]